MSLGGSGVSIGGVKILGALTKSDDPPSRDPTTMELRSSTL